MRKGQSACRRNTENIRVAHQTVSLYVKAEMDSSGLLNGGRQPCLDSEMREVSGLELVTSEEVSSP